MQSSNKNSFMNQTYILVQIFSGNLQCFVHKWDWGETVKSKCEWKLECIIKLFHKVSHIPSNYWTNVLKEERRSWTKPCQGERVRPEKSPPVIKKSNRCLLRETSLYAIVFSLGFWPKIEVWNNFFWIRWDGDKKVETFSDQSSHHLQAILRTFQFSRKT